MARLATNHIPLRKVNWIRAQEALRTVFTELHINGPQSDHAIGICSCCIYIIDCNGGAYGCEYNTGGKALPTLINARQMIKDSQVIDANRKTDILFRMAVILAGIEEE